MGVTLRHVSDPQDWSAYHALRKTVLWRDRIDIPPYDPSHPDETANGHFPFLLLIDDEPAGTIRVDIEPPTAWFRLIAVSDKFQGCGYGRRMLRFTSEFAMEKGCRTVHCNVEPDAVGFYAHVGFMPIGDSPVMLGKPL